MTDKEEKRLGWALAVIALALVVGPFAGSSIVNGLVAVVRTLLDQS